MRLAPLVSCLALAAQAGAQIPAEVPLVIPGVVHKWRTPELDAVPETTIEEMGHCMGLSRTLRGRSADLERQQAVLEAELLELNKQSDAMKGSSTAVATDQAAHDRAVAAFKATDARMDARKAEIAQLVSKGAATDADAKKGNALIASFNADIAKRNRQLEQLLASEKSLNEKIRIHNEGAAVANQRAERFNERNTELEKQVDQFDGDVSRYKATCAGERVLK